MLADRGLMPDMGPAVCTVANWVMNRGQEFVTKDLRSDSRIQNRWSGPWSRFH